MHCSKWAAIGVVAAILTASPCSADTIETFNDGKSKAIFDYNPGTKSLTLQLINNQSSSTGGTPALFLSGLLFHTSGTATISVNGANGKLVNAADGSTYTGTKTVGQGWGYLTTQTGGFSSMFPSISSGMTQAVSASGQLGGNGTPFTKPADGALDGPHYTIVPNGFTGKYTGGQGDAVYVLGSVTLIFKVSSGTLTLPQNVAFLYGTATSETTANGGGVPLNPSAVPLPSSLAMLGSMLVPGLCFFWYRRRNVAVAA